MYHLNDKYATLDALTPQSVAAAGSTTGNFMDMQTRHAYSFAVQLGAVAAGKAVKVELMSSDQSNGTGAEALAEATFTAPAEGAVFHVVVLYGFVRPSHGRYLAVKVSNEGDAAVLCSALLMADNTWYPEDCGATLVVV